MPFFKIQVGPAEVSLECEQKLRTDIVATVFSALLRPTDRKARIHYRVTALNDRWLLFRNNRLTHRNKVKTKIIYALEWQIVEDLLNHNPETLKLHSAALTRQESGLIFCGAPSTGKTSLAILLMQNGWQLLSDEFAILNVERQIIPFPRNLIIKPHLRAKIIIPTGTSVFSLHGDYGEKMEAFYLAPELFGRVATCAPAALKGLIFLEKAEHDGFDLQPLAHYAAFRLLMQHLFNRNIRSRKWIERLVDLANSIPAYSLNISTPLDLPLSARQTLAEQLSRIAAHA